MPRHRGQDTKADGCSPYSDRRGGECPSDRVMVNFRGRQRAKEARCKTAKQPANAKTETAQPITFKASSRCSPTVVTHTVSRLDSNVTLNGER